MASLKPASGIGNAAIKLANNPAVVTNSANHSPDLARNLLTILQIARNRENPREHRITEIEDQDFAKKYFCYRITEKWSLLTRYTVSYCFYSNIELSWRLTVQTCPSL